MSDDPDLRLECVSLSFRDNWSAPHFRNGPVTNPFARGRGVLMDPTDKGCAYAAVDKRDGDMIAAVQVVEHGRIALPIFEIQQVKVVEPGLDLPNLLTGLSLVHTVAANGREIVSRVFATVPARDIVLLDRFGELGAFPCEDIPPDLYLARASTNASFRPNDYHFLGFTECSVQKSAELLLDQISRPVRHSNLANGRNHSATIEFNLPFIDRNDFAIVRRMASGDFD